MVGEKQFCTFYLAGHFFGVNVLRVQEVIRHREMTRVPLASPVVRGLINLRGQIITAIDLRRRLELEDRPDGQVPVNVVIHTDDGEVSLLVDEIGDVLSVPEDLFEPPPEMLPASVRELILGAYKLPERLLVVLDPDLIVSIPESRIART